MVHDSNVLLQAVLICILAHRQEVNVKWTNIFYWTDLTLPWLISWTPDPSRLPCVGNWLTGSQQCSVSPWNILASSLPLPVLDTDTRGGFRTTKQSSPIVWQSFPQNAGSHSSPLDCGLDIVRRSWSAECDGIWFLGPSYERSPALCPSPSVCLPQPSCLVRSLPLGEASCHVVRALKQPHAWLRGKALWPLTSSCVRTILATASQPIQTLGQWRPRLTSFNSSLPSDHEPDPPGFLTLRHAGK